MSTQQAWRPAPRRNALHTVVVDVDLVEENVDMDVDTAGLAARATAERIAYCGGRCGYGRRNVDMNVDTAGLAARATPERAPWPG
jgi:hypothetical protein